MSIEKTWFHSNFYDIIGITYRLKRDADQQRPRNPERALRNWNSDSKSIRRRVQQVYARAGSAPVFRESQGAGQNFRGVCFTLESSEAAGSFRMALERLLRQPLQHHVRG